MVNARRPPTPRRRRRGVTGVLLQPVPRTRSLVVGVLAVFALVGSASAFAATSPTLPGKVTDGGTKQLGSGKRVKLAVAADDFSFSPTYVQAGAGQKIKVKVANKGSAPHTFTSDVLDIDQQVAPGTTKTFTVTVPGTGDSFEYYCRFHAASGMRGAVVVGSGSTGSGAATGSDPSSTTKVTVPSGGYGY